MPIQDPTYGGKFKHFVGNAFNSDGSYNQRYQNFWGEGGGGGGNTSGGWTPSNQVDPLSSAQMSGEFNLTNNWGEAAPPPNPQQELMNIMKQWEVNQRPKRVTAELNKMADEAERLNRLKKPGAGDLNKDALNLKKLMDRLDSWEKQMSDLQRSQETRPPSVSSGGGTGASGFAIPKPWEAPPLPEEPPLPALPGQFQDPGFHGGLVLKGTPGTPQERFSRNIMDPERFKALNELLDGGLVSSLYRKPKGKREVFG